MSIKQSKIARYLWQHRDYIGFTLIFLALLLLIVPAIVNNNAMWTWFGISDTPGTIGDAIGGVTAPFIAFFGALLVYRSFKEQVEANRIQSDALRSDKELSLINDLYRECIDAVKDIRWSVDSGSLALKNFGVWLNDATVKLKSTNLTQEERQEARDALFKKLQDSRVVLQHLVLISRTFIVAAMRIDKAQTLDEEEKLLYSERLRTLAICTLLPGLRQVRDAVMKTKKAKPGFRGIAITIVDFVDSLQLNEKEATLKRFRMNKKKTPQEETA